MGFIKNSLLYLLFTIVFALQIQTAPLTGEKLRFAIRRCADEHNGLNSTLSTLWAQQIFPENRATQCYIKCFLRRLGLVDLQTRGLNEFRFLELLDVFNVTLPSLCVQDPFVDEPLDDRCVTYYRKWTQILFKCPLLGHLMTENASYELPQTKMRGQSAVEFCDKEAQKSLNGVELVVESEVGFLNGYKCVLACVFEYFHYFDSFGRLDEKEIALSFEESKAKSSDNLAFIQLCTKHANAKYNGEQNCDMAFELEQCLMHHTPEFRRIFLQRDFNTKEY